MGLTIHYSLHCDTQSPNSARELLARLRQHALDLPLKEVGDLVEFTGEECDFEDRDRDDPHRRLLVEAGQFIERKEFQFHVPPKHLFAFSTWPGEGCEQVNFGLALYPGILKRESQKIRTGIRGWSWQSFCKPNTPVIPSAEASRTSCGVTSRS